MFNIAWRTFETILINVFNNELQNVCEVKGQKGNEGWRPRTGTPYVKAQCSKCMMQSLCIKYLIAVKPFNAAPVEFLKAEGMKKEFEGFF